MIEHDYRIEALGNTFGKHADIADENSKEALKKYKEHYPQSKIPDHLIDPFNLARALSVMACEIERLKQTR